MTFDNDSKSIHYTPLLPDAGPGNGKDHLMASSSRARRHVVSLTAGELALYLVAWALATVTLVVVAALWLQPSIPAEDMLLREGEFGPAKDAIRIERTLFDVSATFNVSEAQPRRFRKGGPHYVGNPSPEIDAAWNSLLDDQYFYTTEEEAKTAWGAGYRKYWQDESTETYRAGLSVFHTLHCLNILRKEIYKEYYTERQTSGLKAEIQAYHVDHCVDIVRQSVQCSSDLTPIPVLWYDEVSGRQTIDSERVHTCRSIQKIREWTTQRVIESKPRS